MVYYNKQHSITFLDSSDLVSDYYNSNIKRNTWKDWKMIPSTRPSFLPPPVKTNMIDIPGGNGSIDLSTALTGHVTYGNRSGSFEFHVINSNIDIKNGYKDWDVIYSEIMGFIHGKELIAILDDDRSYYYKGRFGVNTFSSNKADSTITIDYNVYPYKKCITNVNEKWLWDPFDFENDYVPSDGGYYNNKLYDSLKPITFVSFDEPVFPSLTITGLSESATVTVRYGPIKSSSKKSKQITIQEGLNFLTDSIFLIPNYEFELTINSDKTLYFTLDYKGGKL